PLMMIFLRVMLPLPWATASVVGENCKLQVERHYMNGTYFMQPQQRPTRLISQFYELQLTCRSKGPELGASRCQLHRAIVESLCQDQQNTYFSQLLTNYGVDEL